MSSRPPAVPRPLALSRAVVAITTTARDKAGGIDGRGASRPVPAVAPVLAVMVVAVLSALALVASGCGGTDTGRTTAKAKGSTDAATTATTTAGSNPSTPSSVGSTALMDAVCDGSAKVSDAGTISSSAITEASGIVASWNGAGDGAKGPWWVHNDSGDSARVFAIDGSANLLATVELDGVEARDWEDIAVGPPVTPGGRAQLYVGDIGNNAAMRSPAGARRSVRIYRLDEPAVPSGPSSGPSSIHVVRADVTSFTLTYPDRAYDAEALLVDPIDGDLIIVTKDWASTGESQVFRVPGAATIAGGSTTVLEHVGSVSTGRGTLVTAADVTRDGSVVALRSYGGVDLYRRPKGEPLWAAFANTPCAGPRVSELQGESLGFAPDGRSYVTLAEGSRPTLHRTSP